MTTTHGLDMREPPFKEKKHYPNARMKACEALAKMGFGTSMDYTYLRLILGREARQKLGGKTFTEEDYNNCKLIAGPHGYAVVKMLCLKHGIKDLQLNGVEQQNLPHT